MFAYGIEVTYVDDRATLPTVGETCRIANARGFSQPYGAAAELTAKTVKGRTPPLAIEKKVWYNGVSHLVCMEE